MWSSPRQENLPDEHARGQHRTREANGERAAPRLSTSFGSRVARLKISSSDLPENRAEQSYYV